MPAGYTLKKKSGVSFSSVTGLETAVKRRSVHSEEMQLLCVPASPCTRTECLQLFTLCRCEPLLGLVSTEQPGTLAGRQGGREAAAAS